jgi:hypothetical protein
MKKNSYYTIPGMENWKMGNVYRMDNGRTSHLILVVDEINTENNGIIPYIGVVDSTSNDIKKYLRKNLNDGNGVVLQLPLTPELIKMEKFELIEGDNKEEIKTNESPIKIQVVEI